MSILLVLASVIMLPGCGSSRTQSPVDTVKQFFELKSKGDYEAAWLLVHSDRRTPDNQSRFIAAAQEEVKGERPVAIRERNRLPTWDDMLKKNMLPNGLSYGDVAEVEIQWPNGAIQVLHMVKDKEGNWRLIWSPQFALE